MLSKHLENAKNWLTNGLKSAILTHVERSATRPKRKTPASRRQMGEITMKKVPELFGSMVFLCDSRRGIALVKASVLESVADGIFKPEPEEECGK